MHKLFIANRGEIAVRIARTAREMGIPTVLGASEADVESHAAKLVDEVVVVGPSPAGKSYLNQEAVLEAARKAGCDAVHPGYGFLSENASFARAVTEAGMTWIGPAAETIELMGHKDRARAAAAEAGVPILPGSDGPVTPEEAEAAAAEIGFPLVVKAAAGGGGRGIRKVDTAEDLAGALSTARAEAKAVFGDDTVYFERFVQNARHIEVQVFGDGTSAIHLGDRDCSMQRRSQKIVEEAPAPDLPDEVRDRIRTSSAELARSCNYMGAGTVEFLYDPQRHEAAFIEMNTRLQVEHPVTEEVTGVDLVELQLRVARGEGLGLTQDAIHLKGHSIEVRLNAEDPRNNFMPSPGHVDALDWPGGPGVRVDSGIEDQQKVAPFYDSMLAKVIVRAQDRPKAIARMIRALEETRLTGVKSTLDLLDVLLQTPEFADVTHHTTFIETAGIQLPPEKEAS